ncbi:MAG: hypothetical protein NVSMB65_11750 [Chloroflexota bacterium]
MLLLLRRPPARATPARKRFRIGLLPAWIHWPLQLIGPVLEHARDVVVERLMGVLITIVVAASVLVLRPGQHLSGDAFKEIASVAIVAWTAVPTIWRHLRVRRTGPSTPDPDDET